jgi:Tol biopolymer transport system component/predicted Ser/Thr protein kinase
MAVAANRTFRYYLIERMLLETGARLGPYQILDSLGEGGMGEVWRARDTRLDRTVAIKKSAARFSDRFEREARSIAALNHPHICTLYDVGPDYLVMEYVEGKPLKGPLPPQEVLSLSAQIADALYAAHVRGIVHRDLKPDNILLTKTGVKLLDFGLARTAAPTASADGRTLTMAVTGEGMIVGTPQYMSPEQVEGKPADARSDIFSLGCVLYEMLTGRKAFTGKSAASVIAAILRSEPPSLDEMRPPALGRVLRTCLAKDPEERWQSARELKHALEWVADTAPPRRARATWIAAAACTLAALAVVLLLLRGPAPQLSPVQFSIEPPQKTVIPQPEGPVISPDGERLVFSAARQDGRSMLWVRALNSLQPQAIAETDDGRLPFWSPDSRSIAFNASGQLKRVDLAGGAVRVLCPATHLAAGSWSSDGLILFGGSDKPIQSVPAQGGEARPVSRFLDGEKNHLLPQLLPDRRHFLFLASRGHWRIGSLDGGPEVPVSVKDSPAMYVSPGYLLFASDGNILAQRFDPKRMRLSGDAVIVSGGVQEWGTVGYYPFSASETGVLTWLDGAGNNSTQLVWLDGAGNRLGTVGEPADYTSPAMSPDGSKLAVAIRDPMTRQRDIWILDLTRGTRTRFTFDPADDVNPVWSPDGGRIAWSSDRKGVRDLYVKAATGVGEDQVLYESPLRKSVEQWSPDGKYLLFNSRRQVGTATEIAALPLSAGPERKPIPLVPAGFGYQGAQLSPDSSFMAYHSNESGAEEIYVQPFPPSGAKWQISTAGGTEAFWGKDGKQLFFVSGNNLMVVPVRTYGGQFEAGAPTLLFGLQLPPVTRNRVLGAGNGRFLVNMLSSRRVQGSMTVLLNWSALLRR